MKKYGQSAAASIEYEMPIKIIGKIAGKSVPANARRRCAVTSKAAEKAT